MITEKDWVPGYKENEKQIQNWHDKQRDIGITIDFIFATIGMNQ
jgi:hypothetical protein